MNLTELKEKNEKQLRSYGIDVNPHLPLIEDLNEVNPRSAQEVASRLAAIPYVIGIGYDANRDRLIRHLKQYHLWDFVSNYEKELLGVNKVSDQDKINMTWLAECAQALAWSINLVELDHFKKSDDDLLSSIIPCKKDPTSFIESSQIRSVASIQRESDLLYRMHWYARNSQLEGEECKLDIGVISERRKAIDWVYGVEKDWDEVPLDT